MLLVINLILKCSHPMSLCFFFQLNISKIMLVRPKNIGTWVVTGIGHKLAVLYIIRMTYYLYIGRVYSHTRNVDAGHRSLLGYSHTNS